MIEVVIIECMTKYREVYKEEQQMIKGCIRTK